MTDHTKPTWLDRWKTPTAQPAVDEEIKATIEKTVEDLDGESINDPLDRTEIDTPDVPLDPIHEARKKLVNEILDAVKRK